MSRGKHEWQEGNNVVWDSSVIVGMTNDPAKKHYHYREYLKRGFVYHIEISEAEAIKGMVDLGMKPDAAINVVASRLLEFASVKLPLTQMGRTIGDILRKRLLPFKEFPEDNLQDLLIAGETINNGIYFCVADDTDFLDIAVAAPHELEAIVLTVATNGKIARKVLPRKIETERVRLMKARGFQMGAKTKSLAEKHLRAKG